MSRRKSTTRRPKPQAAYALHIDAKRVARLRRIARKQFVEPSMAELVRAILDLGMDYVEKNP